MKKYKPIVTNPNSLNSIAANPKIINRIKRSGLGFSEKLIIIRANNNDKAVANRSWLTDIQPIAE